MKQILWRRDRPFFVLLNSPKRTSGGECREIEWFGIQGPPIKSGT